MKKYTLAILVAFLSINTVEGMEGFRLPGTKKPVRERMYIDEDELHMNGDSFHIHVGHNEWISTRSIHRDETGLFTYEHRIFRDGVNAGVYEKSWKCPYCHSYWPLKTKCQNPDCPSKYL